MKQVKQITVIYVAILAGVLIFFGVAVSQVKSVSTELMGINLEELLIPGLIVSVITTFASFVIVPILLQKVIAKESLNERLAAYMTVAIVRYALIESGMLIGVIFFMLTGAWMFAVLFLFLVLVYLVFFPSRNRVERDIQMTIEG